MGSFRYFFDSFYQSYRMVMIAITFYDTSVFMIFMDHSLMNRGGSCMSLQSRGGKVQMQLKKKIRGLTIIAIVAMLMSLLVACAGNSSKGSSDNAQTGSNVSSNNQSSQAGGNKEQVTLRFSWWGSDVRHQATLDAIAAYMELNPHVKIEGEYQGYDGYQQKIMTQIAGNSAPDIMQLDYPWLPDLAAQGDNFVDLSQESAVDLSQFPQTVLEEYNSVNGKIVALPMGTNGYGTMINKAFFEKHNLSTDTVWTWDQLIEEGRRINQENPGHHLFAIEPGTTTGGLGEFLMNEYLYSKNGEYWVSDKPEIKASEEDILEALTVIKELFDSGAAQPLGDAALFNAKMEQNPKWINAEMGMTVDWSSTVGKYKAAAGEENFTTGMPIFVKDGKSTSVKFKPSMILAVNNKTKHKDEAVKFINWLLNSPEAALILLDTRSVPTSEIAKQTLVENNKIDPEVAKMVDNALANPASPPPIVQNNPQIADAIRSVIEQVVFGNLTPEKGASEMISTVNDLFNSLK